MELYFDADNGALLYKTKEGYYEIVKTNAQLDPTHVRIDETGYLYLKSYVDDSESQMMDVHGNPISLKGPAGDKGDKGDKGDQGLPGEQGLKGDSGPAGFTPTFDITDNGELAIHYAQVEDKPDFPWAVNIKGPAGDPGKDGQTPYINMSGNWAIGDRDTGIKAEGKDGADGKDGKDGINGQDGKDAPLPQLQIVDGSVQYKLSDTSDWTTLITNKEIFVEPDVRNSLPENPTDGQIITWEGNPDIDHNFEPGKKYQYLAAGRIIKETKLLGKAPNSESYTVFNLVSIEAIPSFSLESIKKEILTSNDRIITPAGTYCKMNLTEGQTSLQSLQPIYDDGAKMIPSITGSEAVRTLIDTNPSETHWAVSEVEEVLSSGKWIQIL